MTETALSEQVHDAWQKRFPGEKGRVLAEVLLPYYQPTLSFKPRPPLADLETKLPQLFPWRKVSGLCFISATSLRLGIPAALQKILGGGSFVSLGHELREVSDRFQSKLGDVEWKKVLEGVGGGFGFVYTNRLRYDLAETLGGDDNCQTPLNEKTADGLEPLLWYGLEESLLYGAGLIVLEDNFSLIPLISVWPMGNLPIGFDQQGRALIIVE